MNKEIRIKNYNEALNFYKAHPDGIGGGRSCDSSRIYPKCFHGICDIMGYFKSDFPELIAVRPRNRSLFWWAQSKTGVKTRIKKLKLMIKMAEEATE